MRISTEVNLQLTDDPLVYIAISETGYEYSGQLALADRAAQAEAQQAQKTAAGTAAGYGQTAQGIGSNIIPTLERDVNNAPGLTPTQKSAELVAGEQGAGGATAGVTGQAGLNALRTRNTGATSSVLDDAMRRKAQLLSQNALGVEKQNTNLQQQQRAQGLAGLEGLYGTDVGAQLKSMGIQNSDINTQIEAGKSGWLQNAEGIGSTLAGMASKGAGIAGGYGG
jgi:hypothetical protein